MDPVAEVPTGPQTSEHDFGQPGASSSCAAPVFGCMERLSGPSSSEVPTGPQTSEHDFGQPVASSSCAAPATKRDAACSTASESADPRTQKGSNLSRLPSFKKQAARTREILLSNKMLEAQFWRKFRRMGKAIAELDTGKADVEHQTCELVLSEAEISTEWYQAIERKDCKTLMNLLRQEGGSALLLKTGKAGRMALHVAAIQGSLELVHTIRGFYPSAAITKEFPHQLTRAIDGRCAMKAVDIAFHIVGYFSREQKKINDDFMIEDETFTPDLELSAHKWRSNYKLTRDIIKSIEQMITSVWKEGTVVGCYKGLMESFEQNVDYNFCNYEIYGHLFLFHHACSRVDGQEFVKDVIEHCSEVCEEGLIELMRLRDFQGRTPLHVATAVAPDKGREEVLGNLFRCLGMEAGDRYNKKGLKYLGVRDGRGWTPLHLAATQPYSYIYTLFGEDIQDSSIVAARIDDHYANGGGTGEYCTALHLAVLHNNSKFVNLFEYAIYVSTRSTFWSYCWADTILRDIYCADTGPATPFGKAWSTSSLALLLGNEDIADILSSQSVLSVLSEYMYIAGPSEIPIICLVASLGNIEILRQLLNYALDPFERDPFGQTCLHYAATGLIEPCNDYNGCTWKTMIPTRQAYPFICATDVPNVAWLDGLYECTPKAGRVNNGYSARKGNINMLLQVGVDIWQKDKRGKIAIPGRRIIDDDFVSWWHEKMAKEALDLRYNLNQRGNAISVIGALIATASYVGPLQPPLSFGSDPAMQFSPTSDNTTYAHVWDPYVKIFMVSNGLSFYLAIASILLVVVPSLPMPHESLLNELERTRKTMASAICALLLSVVSILVSYATTSIAVMPNHTSFINVRWTSYPTLVGGFGCLIGIALFLNRAMHLMFPEMSRWLMKVPEETFGKKVLMMTFGKFLFKLYKKLYNEEIDVEWE